MAIDSTLSFRLSSFPPSFPVQPVLAQVEQAVPAEVPGRSQVAGLLLAGHLPGFPQHPDHRLRASPAAAVADRRAGYTFYSSFFYLSFPFVFFNDSPPLLVSSPADIANKVLLALFTGEMLLKMYSLGLQVRSRNLLLTPLATPANPPALRRPTSCRCSTASIASWCAAGSWRPSWWRPRSCRRSASPCCAACAFCASSRSPGSRHT